jgi:hypothetical protein
MQAEFDTVNETSREILAPLGFELVRGTRWVSTPSNSIRRMFEFAPLKGGTYSARWGFSIDFVPKLQGSSLKWKRTLRSVEFDLCIDPIDETGTVLQGNSLCPLHQNSIDPQQLRLITCNCIERACADFQSIAALSDLISLYEKRSRVRFRRFGLHNYIQTELAWGLSLIAIGNRPDGELHIKTFCEKFSVNAADQILQAAILEAERFAKSTLN